MPQSSNPDSRLPDVKAPQAMPSSAGPDACPRFDIATMLGEWREAILVHNGEAYRLRVTANNKLILTK
jgi:hemin uptake protein HemP